MGSPRSLPNFQSSLHIFSIFSNMFPYLQHVTGARHLSALEIKGSADLSTTTWGWVYGQWIGFGEILTGNQGFSHEIYIGVSGLNFSFNQSINWGFHQQHMVDQRNFRSLPTYGRSNKGRVREERVSRKKRRKSWSIFSVL